MPTQVRNGKDQADGRVTACRGTPVAGNAPILATGHTEGLHMGIDRLRSRTLSLAFLIITISSPALLIACGAAPGEEAEAAPAASADAQPVAPQQDQHPVDELELYLAGVHVMKENIREWWDAHHYCQMLRPDVTQCAVYDTTSSTAHLVAIEYIVPGEVYRSFPPEEQQYWHPHTYEVNGGLLALPELPADSARELLLAIRPTYGKTWHLWQTQEGDRYPVGEPTLAWAIEGPDSIPPGVVPRGNALTGRQPRR